ncbi:MAG: bifunctional 4-hydroxy-2-oxoglutarate aldolase/2-dehydro-3-deoxy-phosphogluconate aldolase [Piscinibacter sp.]|nr:bifunctional 4-hydroxy-2-oxoglutarate aldolase/2-dehydro-3-deoxy-phosphogluconate aldolase [Piscinibacter sp.]
MPRELLKIAPVIPVLRLDDVDTAVPVAEALVAGGLPVIEITLRTPEALACITAMRKAVPQAIIGAGTVLDATQFTAAVEAGAQFVVSPGFSIWLVDSSRRHRVPLLPGAVTPTEIMAALDAGLDTLKFFPAAQSGGAPMLGALAAPLPHVAFCPTGGISLANAADYLSLPNVLCVGMSSLISSDKIAGRDWAGIQASAQKAAALRR